MFPCSRCGLCCRRVGSTFLGKGMALPNGICRYLDQETNLCTIYKERPLFCNVDAYYDKYMKGKMTREAFYALNQAECKRMQASNGTEPCSAMKNQE